MPTWRLLKVSAEAVKKEVLFSRNIPLYQRDTIKRGLIVFDYYVRGKKKLALIIPNRISLAQMLSHIHYKRQGKVDQYRRPKGDKGGVNEE